MRCGDRPPFGFWSLFPLLGTRKKRVHRPFPRSPLRTSLASGVLPLFGEKVTTNSLLSRSLRRGISSPLARKVRWKLSPILLYLRATRPSDLPLREQEQGGPRRTSPLSLPPLMRWDPIPSGQKENLSSYLYRTLMTSLADALPLLGPLHKDGDALSTSHPLTTWLPLARAQQPLGDSLADYGQVVLLSASEGGAPVGLGACTGNVLVFHAPEALHSARL